MTREPPPTYEAWLAFLKSNPVYEPRSFLDLPSDPETRGPYYEANMRAMELAQDAGRLIWLRHVGDPNPFPRFRLFRWLP